MREIVLSFSFFCTFSSHLNSEDLARAFLVNTVHMYVDIHTHARIVAHALHLERSGINRPMPFYFGEMHNVGRVMCQPFS